MNFLYIKHGILYKDIKPFILRGMGLGGWLLPEGYMWKFYTKCDRPRRIEALIYKLCGKTYSASFWEKYRSLYITESDIAWIAKQGLNSVRLPLNSRNLFNIDINGTIQFNKAVLVHVDNCIKWCKKYELYLFLDMHGAPGGQTGENIDDSEANRPELFIYPENQALLIKMWHLLAERYNDEPCIGGYDLLNEPLTEKNQFYYSHLLPLYRRLITAIRKFDQNHIIILEGVHWATDFSVFEDFTSEEAADNIMLEFHKYWSNPDKESLLQYIDVGKRLNTPIWMGEGGENNLQWYTYMFPLYEKLGIGWCFWSYKKMETHNSPVSFSQPCGWVQILTYLDSGIKPKPTVARTIFNEFLSCIAKPTYCSKIINAILRRPPLEIPAAAYDIEQIISHKQENVYFRKTDKATLCFADGHTGSPNWQRYGGEPQPDCQKILLCLRTEDSVGYYLEHNNQEKIAVKVIFFGNGKLTMQGKKITSNRFFTISADMKGFLWLKCIEGSLKIDVIQIEKKFHLIE